MTIESFLKGGDFLEENNFMKLFKTELIDLDNEVTNQKDFFDKKYFVLLEKGYVKDSFKNAIIERESKYPTGLVLENINIAIPHTDSDHIKEPFVYINRSENEIEFNQMGNEDELVSVKDIWILGIKNGSKQVKLLAFIMEIFNNPEFIEKYRNVKKPEDLIDLLKENTK